MSVELSILDAASHDARNLLNSAESCATRSAMDEKGVLGPIQKRRVHAFQTAVRRIIEHHERVYKDYLYLLRRETTIVLKSLAKPKCTQDVRIHRPYEAHVLVLSSE